ncbi:hypothetical protein HMN09_00492100 [Mycena chlorophos]|uniref:Glycosyltransferase family 18 catalytic domain-containing protein n=1 Tax=Mycena chlorophos TaxID=658473 RepID=A0A8H6WC75_MYCCL|nr:hypothetical protein HMN09_00492100 [Mycena chlorophos]
MAPTGQKRRSFKSQAVILFTLSTLVYVAFHFRAQTQRALTRLPYLNADAEEEQQQHQPTVEESTSLQLSIPSTLYPPEVGDAQTRRWMDPSEADWVRLHRCLLHNTCGPNQLKVVLVQSMYFRNALRGDLDGEEIWAMSAIEAMANLGYTVLYVDSLRDMVRIYQFFPSLVRIAIVNDWDAFACWKDTENCLRSEHNPFGIPGYKLISFYFWTFPRHPLGPRWIISPEPYQLQLPGEFPSNNTYLGYSIEKTCRSTKFVPAHERPASPPQAWILAKYFMYFFPEKDFAWSKEILDDVAAATGVRFGMAIREPPEPMTEEQKERIPLYLPEEAHYVDLHRLDQAHFLYQLTQSRVVIGIGRPTISPTPWNALCLGVPFINVVTEFDDEHPDDKTKWKTQHPITAVLGPPMVYNVRKGDKQGLIDAVRAALDNPIDSFVPERMTLPSIETRMAALVDNDWEAEERALLRECREPCGCTEPCDVLAQGIPWHVEVGGV